MCNITTAIIISCPCRQHYYSYLSIRTTTTYIYLSILLQLMNNVLLIIYRKTILFLFIFGLVVKLLYNYMFTLSNDFHSYKEHQEITVSLKSKFMLSDLLANMPHFQKLMLLSINLYGDFLFRNINQNEMCLMFWFERNVKKDIFIEAMLI